MEDRTLLTAGDLDPTFGVGGKVLTQLMGPIDVFGSRAAIQTDGKIVVAGYNTAHFFLARYTVDGRLDSTFGSGGEIQTDFGTNHAPTIANVAIQPDGKIIVGGTDNTGFNSTVFSVERFRSDGSLDKTFGTGGKASAGIGSVSVAYGLALQADGKIVVLGAVNGLIPGSFGVIRFNADGSLDSGFGTGGKVLTPFGRDLDIPFGVVIQGDGKIVVGGSAAPNGKTQLAVARYNGNGTLDNSFGAGGMVTGVNAGLYPSLALQPDGRIVIGQTLLVRLNTNGSVDSSFGTGGAVTPKLGINDLIVQPDGKIVAVGNSAVARYNVDGSVDTTFGTGGQVTTDVRSEDGVTLQSDGKIVAVGTGSVSPTISGFAVARLNPDGSPDTGFGAEGKVVTAFSGILGFPANAIAIQPDGKIVMAGGGSSPVLFGVVRYNPNGP